MTAACDRLTAEQQFALRNLAASFAMDGIDLDAAEIEILAAYALDEITREQCIAQLDAHCDAPD
jgi:hypothetical protein